MPSASRPARPCTHAATDVVDFVMPSEIDDPRRPSGGNRYDRRLSDELTRIGWHVCERLVPAQRDGHLPGRRYGDVTSALTTTDVDGWAPTALVDGLIAVAAPDAVIAAAQARPVVILVHMPFGHSDTSLAAAEGGMLAQVAGVITSSAWTKRFLVESYRLPADYIEVAPPGVDRPITAGTDENADESAGGSIVGQTAGGRLLCVAPVTYGKGYDVLLAALHDLAHQPGPADQTWHCRCVGSMHIEPGFAAQIRARASNHALAARVSFSGPLRPSQLHEAYEMADLLVLASRAETWGMVISEVLSHGIPVVASDVGGVREALGTSPDGSLPGLLVPPGDAAALGAALRRWLDEPATRQRLRASARARAPELPGWNETAARVVSAINAATRAGRADRTVRR